MCGQRPPYSPPALPPLVVHVGAARPPARCADPVRAWLVPSHARGRSRVCVCLSECVCPCGGGGGGGYLAASEEAPQVGGREGVRDGGVGGGGGGGGGYLPLTAA